MADNTRELLDRQTEFLLDQESDTEFLVQVPAYLRTLREEPRLAIHMEDLRRDATDLGRAHEEHDAEEIRSLTDMRAELVRLAPETDDSAQPPPEHGIDAMFDWHRTLAGFDRVVRGELSAEQGTRRDLGRTGWLIDVLHSKLYELRYPRGTIDGEPSRSETNQRPDLDDLAQRLGNVSRRHDHFVNGLRLAERVSAGLALARLDTVVEALNPPPAAVGSPYEMLRHLNEVAGFVASGDYTLYYAVHHERLDDPLAQYVADRVRGFRKDVRRLHEELRRRIGTTASRLALVLRFKHRAEWYDRDRLRALAEADGPGTIEDRLTGELVRFLFDQGLSPLTKPMTGGLQPDVLDPSLRPGFYVEAKQYGDKGNPRQTVTRSVAQVHDTAGTMRAEPYRVHEAFVVVFRRGGPRYSLPERLPGDGWTTHLVLVDISDPSESGSRALRRPVNLTIGDFVDGKPSSSWPTISAAVAGSRPSRPSSTGSTVH